MIEVKIIPKYGLIRPAKTSKSPPFFATAIIPNRGKPTPVIKNPIIDRTIFSPAICPSCGGNMIFPAPRNKANNIKPTAIFSRKKPLLLFMLCKLLLI